jgi:8-oxo-dGTP diphosphatase
MKDNMHTKPDTPKVGVGLIVLNEDGQILLLLRKGSHGTGTWSMPGGHFELWETEFDCCARELKEETNLDLVAMNHYGFANNIMIKEGLHYVTLFYIVNKWDGELKNMEPNKCSEMGWFDLDELPEPLFGATKSVLKREATYYDW